MGSKVKRSEICFDRKTGTYLPGELVSGQVFVEFLKPKQIKGIRVVAKGESVVQWAGEKPKTNNEGDDEQVLLSGYEEYFSSKYYLFGSDSGSPSTLPAGLVVYPFKFNLPMNVPNSFEHDLGFVRYTVKVLFDGPWKVEHEIKATFNVVSTYDLNENRGAALAIEEKVIKSFCCFCVCMSGKLYATISVPASGFVPGQSIPVTVYCENESSVDVSKIKIRLVEKIKFHAKTPRWETKEDEVVVATKKWEKPFVNNSEEHVTLELRVPPTPPSGLDFCGLIDVEYFLKIDVAFTGFHCSVKRSFPLLIGTVPLYSFSNVASSMLQPTAPQLAGPSFQTPQFPGMATAPVDGVPQQRFFGNAQGAHVQYGSPYDPYLMNQQNYMPPPYEASVQRP